MKSLLMLVLISCIPFWISAQNFEEEMMAVRTFYEETPNFAMNVSIKGYMNESDLLGVGLGSSVIRKKGHAYYSYYEGEEFMCDGKNILILNHLRKSASYTKFSNEIRSRNPVSTVEALVSNYRDVAYVGKEDGYRHYTVFNRESNIVKTEMWIDTINHSLSKLEYYYSMFEQKEELDFFKVEIKYSNVLTGDISKEFFNLRRYVSVDSSGVRLKGVVQNYQLNENLAGDEKPIN